MLSIAMSFALAAVPGTPLLLRAEPLPWRPTGLEQVDGGEWRVLFGHWSEYGGARFSALRLRNRWVVAPLGDAYAWKDWIAIEGVVPAKRSDDEHPPELPQGASIGVNLGTDDFFARRVVLVHRRTGARVEAPWDTIAPFPLGNNRWLLLRCKQQPDSAFSIWAVVWNSASGTHRELGRFVEDGLCSSLHPGMTLLAEQKTVVRADDGAWVQLRSDGGSHWVKLDAAGRGKPSGAPALPTDAGTPLRPFEPVRPAAFSAAVTADGRPLVVAFADGGTAPLQPGLGVPFGVYQGFLFSDDGVFELPRGVMLEASP